jgi:hypothetical protein
VSDESAPASVTTAWDRCVEAWQDPARHDALFALVAQHSAYAWAAAKYKTRGDDPIAAKQIAKLQRAATAAMMATAGTRPDPDGPQPYRATIGVFVVLLIALDVGLFFVNYMRSKHEVPVTKPARP